MADETSTHIGGNVNVTGGGDFVGRDKVTNIYQGGSTPAELTPEQLAAVESRYRAQVGERYNRLGFAGLGIGDLRLSDVPLDDVFVRLTLTVEKIVREPIPTEEWAQEREREERSRNPFRRGEKKEDDRPQERTITVQEPITLGEALAQHALIVGEPGAGKSTLLRWLAVTFAAGRQQEADRLGPQADADRLPLLVELGRLPEAYLQANSRETPNWKTFLPQHLTKQPPFDDIPALFLEQALAAGRCLLLCDGLDEIADLSARRRIADSLADYARSSANRLVLSSRPAGVNGSEASLGARFQRLTIQRFAPEDVRRFFGFLCAQYEELTPAEQAKEADALFRAVESAPKTLELATTPLLATLLLLLWNENGYLPERWVELYERCCQMLIESWEAQHDVAYTGVLAEIGWERHLRLLAPLAYAIHNTGQRTDAPARELIPVLVQAMQNEGLATPASATLEAEKFLRTLSLRSGLLQFLGGDRYGFPHLTFQEYLTARHIAAQPDPDYIDLVMPHLHKAWWREVHLLVIGHLGSGIEGVEVASKLLRMILYRYRPPWRLLRSKRFGNPLAVRVTWQLERRLAWVLAREFTFATTGFFDCAPLGVDAELRSSLAHNAQGLLWQIVRDTGRREDGDEMPLQTAARVLVQLGQASSEVVSVLVGALGDSDSGVREATARSLGQLGQASGEVLSVLVGALGDSDSRVQEAAARSLGQLGQASGEIVSALVGALVMPLDNYKSLSLAREAAARSLVQLGQASGEAVSALIEALDDSDARMREEVASSLGGLGQAPGQVLSALVGAVGDSDSGVREEVASSLGGLGQAPGQVLSALVGALGDSYWGVRKAAARSLGQLGQASGEVVSVLVEALSDSDYRVRISAASSLGGLGQASGEVVSVLVEALGDSNYYVRILAAAHLGELGQASGEVVSALVSALVMPLSDTSDGTPTYFIGLGYILRSSAARSLGQLGQASGEIVSALVGALVMPLDNYKSFGSGAREAAARSLGQLGQAPGEVLSALVGALGDSNSSVREAAASSLVQLGQVSGEVVSALVEALGDSYSSGVREAAASSLVQLIIEDETQLRSVLVALNRRLHDRDNDVRREALTAIRRLLDGRQIPGYRWVPIRERRERARSRRIFWYWVLGISVAVLVAWVAAGLTTYVSLDEFWVRFVGALAALVALAAGGVQVLGWFRRPPWDR